MQILIVMLKLLVTAVYEASWYFIMSVCSPTADKELVKKLRIGVPVLVETLR